MIARKIKFINNKKQPKLNIQLLKLFYGYVSNNYTPDLAMGT